MPRTLALAAACAVAALLGAALAGAEEGPPPADPAGSRLVTLHAGDPVTHTLNLSTGLFGGRIEGTRFVETRAHLDYGTYAENALSLALEEDDRGVFVDLGHWTALREAYGYDEADGGGIGFASIALDGDRVRIARRRQEDSPQTLREARPILSSHPGERRTSVVPLPGHILLVRLEDRLRKATPLLAKILVVSHVPGDSVTLRWALLPSP